MKAWLLRKNKIASTPVPMEIGEAPKPTPEAGEVLIKVRAVGLNPVDYKLADGAYFWDHDQHILGLDGAGVVEEVGAGVSDCAKGDRVVVHHNLQKNGGYAEFVVVSGDAVSLIPENISFERAAALPCAGYTAWQGVCDKLNVKSGQWVLVTGGGGGVGGFAIQLAKMRGAKVITTASKDIDRLKALGADFVINYRTEDVEARVLEITEGFGVHGIFDTVSAESAEELLPLVHYNGGIVCAADRVRTNTVPPFTTAPSLHELALGAAYSHGSKVDVRYLGDLGREMLKLVAEGRLDPLLKETIAFDQIRDALLRVRGRHVQGKIVAIL